MAAPETLDVLDQQEIGGVSSIKSDAFKNAIIVLDGSNDEKCKYVHILQTVTGKCTL